MKLLDTKIIYSGFTLTQISRDGNIAVYSQVWNGCKNPSVAYEVIRIQSHNGREIMGKHFPPAEFYPSSEQWGRAGWTCTSKDRALSKALESTQHDLATLTPRPKQNESYAITDTKEGII